MEIEISETTEKHILEKYPHLTKSDVQVLFSEGQIVKEPEDISFKPEHELRFDHLKRSSCTLHVPKTIANILEVDSTIDLIPDENGIIFKQEVGGNWTLPPSNVHLLKAKHWILTKDNWL